MAQDAGDWPQVNPGTPPGTQVAPVDGACLWVVDSMMLRAEAVGACRPPVARAAARSGGSPGRRDYTIGFRLALSAER